MLALEVALVGELTWIVRVAPEARSPKLQVSTCGFVARSEERRVGKESGQLRPEEFGKESEKLTDLAVPDPPIVRPMSKPIVSPAETGPVGFAAFVRLTVAHCTTTEAWVFEPVAGFVVG